MYSGHHGLGSPPALAALQPPISSPLTQGLAGPGQFGVGGGAGGGLLPTSSMPAPAPGPMAAPMAAAPAPVAQPLPAAPMPGPPGPVPLAPALGHFRHQLQEEQRQLQRLQAGKRLLQPVQPIQPHQLQGQGQLAPPMGMLAPAPSMGAAGMISSMGGGMLAPAPSLAVRGVPAAQAPSPATAAVTMLQQSAARTSPPSMPQQPSRTSPFVASHIAVVANGPAPSIPCAPGGAVADTRNSLQSGVGAPAKNNPPKKATVASASVPAHMLSQKPSLGFLGGNTKATPSPPINVASAPTPPMAGLMARSKAGESFKNAVAGNASNTLPSSSPALTSSAGAAASKLPPANGGGNGNCGGGDNNCINRKSGLKASPATPRRHSSSEVAVLTAKVAQSAVASDGGSDPQQREQQQVSKKRKANDGSAVTAKADGARPAVRRSSSMPNMVSPQTFLDSLLKTRGYSTASYCSLETGYYSKPTPYQKASYGLALVRAVRSSDGPTLSSMLASGLSRNPCNAFGESLVHMVCRRGDHGLLRVMLDRGATLQVSDDFGRTPLHDACWTAEPSFECVDLILERDVRLLRILDCRGSSPLSYAKKEHWSEWIEYLERKKDTYWPARDVKAEGEERPPDMVTDVRPNGRPVPDPDDMLDEEDAKAVAAGTLSPEEAMRRRRGSDSGSNNGVGGGGGGSKDGSRRNLCGNQEVAVKSEPDMDGDRTAPTTAGLAASATGRTVSAAG